MKNASSPASYHPVDEEFVKEAATLGVSQAVWDQSEHVGMSFPHAYRYTTHYRIGPALAPEQWQRGTSLDLTMLKGIDADGELDLATLLRDRLKNHSMVVLQGDALVHQHFYNGMDEHSTHLDMSVTKSFTAILAAVAVAEDKLDMSRSVEYYLPELKGTAFAGCTVQEVSDMRSGLDIPTAEFMSWDPLMTQSQNWNGENDSGLHGVNEYVKSLRERKYPPGKVYQYQDPNTEVLGMVVESATGQKLADYLQKNVWTRIGAENDARWMSGPDGFAVASGGLNITTRDLARTGKVILNGGKNYLGEPVIPEDFLDALWRGNDEVRSAWKLGDEVVYAPDGWYKDQFRVITINGHKLLVMIGVHGQVLAVEKNADVVIAMNGGYPQTESPRMVNLIFFQVIPAILHELA
jgi:hypothetical protein